jgi:PAS domain S-box-containing protein
LEELDFLRRENAGLRALETERWELFKSLRDSESRLRHSEAGFRLLFEKNPVPMWIHDRDTLRFLAVNEMCVRRYEYSLDEFLTMRLPDLHPAEDQARLTAHLERTRNDDAPFTGEWKHRFKNGRIIDIEATAHTIDFSGKPARFVMARDITARKQMVAALLESEQRFRQLMENSDDVFWVSEYEDDSLKSLYVSPAYERVWGRAREGITTAAWLETIHTDDGEDVHRDFKAWMHAGCIGEHRAEYRILRPDGSVRWIWDRVFPIRNADGKIYRLASISQDITERKRIEEEHLKMSKLESLGVLAGGIAHDFNNLLTAILGNITFASHYAAGNEKVVARLKDVEDAGERAKTLAMQLLTFAKGGIPVRKVTALDKLIFDTVSFVLRGSNVHCRFEISETLAYANVDVGQISQVLQNLTLNARDAMPKGGELTIRAENVRIDSSPNGMFAPGDYIRITVADTGKGIPPGNLAKIFDPYFTTKPTGTGLGLAVTYSVIKKHGGHITVASTPGVGTTFEIHLPSASTAPHAAHFVSPSVERREGAAHRILVMDDEPMIRRFVADSLEEFGYEVVTTPDGAAAVVTYQEAQRRSPFSAVLLDLTVPGGMGGRETVQKLLTIDPNVKAIVCSGYSHDPVMANYATYGFRGMLVKPFAFDQLRAILDKILNGSPNGSASNGVS